MKRKTLIILFLILAVILIGYIFYSSYLINQKIIPCKVHYIATGRGSPDDEWEETKVSISEILSSKELTFFSCEERVLVFFD